jgi:hypothetical protein
MPWPRALACLWPDHLVVSGGGAFRFVGVAGPVVVVGWVVG